MYAQIKIGYDLPFTKVEKDNIEKLKKILKEKEITKETLYKYGLYLCLIAADIKSINKKTINKMYKELPIHDKNEINIKAEELMQEFGICGKMISTTFEELEHLIINNKLKNKRSEIIKYLKQK